VATITYIPTTPSCGNCGFCHESDYTSCHRPGCTAGLVCGFYLPREWAADPHADFLEAYEQLRRKRRDAIKLRREEDNLRARREKQCQK